jgi:hypothetical protein
MPVYDFEFDDGGNPLKLVDQRLDPKNEIGLEERPLINPLPIGLQNGQQKTDIFFERQNVNIAEEVHEFVAPGYRTMDRGIKNYFSGMQVPTKDGVKLMQVRIAGGDKPYLIWAQDLKLGRVTLPVMAITRTSDEHNAMKFSPAHTHYMTKRFLDSEGSRVALVYRPVPALINYTLSVWGESKLDLEHILYQVRTRFHPLAEYFVEDEHLRGAVQLRYNGYTDGVDNEVPADTRANKRHDYSVTMEGWLPLPEKIVPTVLGRVISLNESTIDGARDFGPVLDVVSGRIGPNGL